MPNFTVFPTGYNEIVLPALRAALHANRVPFLIVGAHALSHHGHTRPTHDIDILVSPAHMPQFRAFLESAGINTSDIPFHRAHEGILVRVGTPPDRIDFTTRIDGPTFESAYPNRSGDFIGFFDCLANKLASPRQKDHADAQALTEILKNYVIFGI